jgi:hypothetical protein
MSTTNPIAPTVLHPERRHHAITFSDGPEGRDQVCYPINYDEVYNLKGRLLTLVDATNGDPQQRKALKDLVWQTLQRWMNDIETAAGGDPSPVTVDNDEPIRLV